MLRPVFYPSGCCDKFSRSAIAPKAIAYNNERSDFRYNATTMTLARPPITAIPLLENGDRLTRTEFERRYHAMPHCKKAELIEGQVYMASSVRARKHS